MCRCNIAQCVEADFFDVSAYNAPWQGADIHFAPYTWAPSVRLHHHSGRDISDGILDLHYTLHRDATALKHEHVMAHACPDVHRLIKLVGDTDSGNVADHTWVKMVRVDALKLVPDAGVGIIGLDGEVMLCWLCMSLILAAGAAGPDCDRDAAACGGGAGATRFAAADARPIDTAAPRHQYSRTVVVMEVLARVWRALSRVSEADFNVSEAKKHATMAKRHIEKQSMPSEFICSLPSLSQSLLAFGV